MLLISQLQKIRPVKYLGTKTNKALSEFSTYIITGVYATLNLALIISNQMPYPYHAVC